jgi:preprotein translocase subunit YajC
MMYDIAAILPQGTLPGWLQYAPMVLILVIFYVLIFVPQARQRKQHRTMTASLAKGDRVVTMGGLVGEVVSVRDDVVTLRTGQAVVAVERDRIARRTGGASEAKQG